MVNGATCHLPPPIPPVEIASAVTPLTVANEGKKRQLQKYKNKKVKKLKTKCFYQ